jgi:hypothetical protein
MDVEEDWNRIQAVKMSAKELSMVKQVQIN